MIGLGIILCVFCFAIAGMFKIMCPTTYGDFWTNNGAEIVCVLLGIVCLVLGILS